MCASLYEHWRVALILIIGGNWIPCAQLFVLLVQLASRTDNTLCIIEVIPTMFEIETGKSALGFAKQLSMYSSAACVLCCRPAFFSRMECRFIQSTTSGAESSNCKDL